MRFRTFRGIVYAWWGCFPILVTIFSFEATHSIVDALLIAGLGTAILAPIGLLQVSILKEDLEDSGGRIVLGEDQLFPIELLDDRTHA
jgi:hypothetical protein